MASVHITLTDTATGGVAVQSRFAPEMGQPCTAAQAAALVILTRASAQLGVEVVHVDQQPAQCQCRHELTWHEMDTRTCTVCDKAVRS